MPSSAPLLGLEDREALGVEHRVGVHGLGAVGDLVAALEVGAGVVRVAVLDKLGVDVAHHAPLDEREVAHDGENVGVGGREDAVHGVGGSGGDAVEVADLEVERNLGVEAHAGRGDAELAQRGREHLGEREAGDVVIHQFVAHGVDVGHGVFGGGHGLRLGSKGGVAGQRSAGLGVHRVVHDVIERAAHRGGLVVDDVVDDLETVVLVGPAKLVGDAGGGHDLEALAGHGRELLLVGALLRALLHDLGLSRLVEDEVVGVGERLRGGRRERGDGGRVADLLEDGGDYARGELDLGGVCCHVHSLVNQVVNVCAHVVGGLLVGLLAVSLENRGRWPAGCVGLDCLGLPLHGLAVGLGEQRRGHARCF